MTFSNLARALEIAITNLIFVECATDMSLENQFCYVKKLSILCKLMFISVGKLCILVDKLYVLFREK